WGFLGPDRLAGEVYMSRMREETESGRAAVFVADEGDRIVGFVFAGVEDESWNEMRDAAGFVHDLIVDESHRRAGIGSALVHAALDWFGARGIARIMVWTAPPNVAAQRLFDRLGFRRTMIEMTRDSQ